MTPEKEKELIEKYPKLFIQKDLPPTQSSMCFGIAVNDGWHKILDAMCEKLDSIGKVEFVQIKEKFGQLRVYFNRKTDDTYEDSLKTAICRDIIHMAEFNSSHVCEFCGSYGKTRPVTDYGWVKTICDPCFEKKMNEGD